MSSNVGLFQDIKTIQDDETLYDLGGGSPLDKCYIMAYLAKLFQYKVYVEIGVYRGRSLFSLAQAFKCNGGRVIGIDPYLNAEAIQNDIDESIKDTVNEFMQAVDMDELYKSVILKREQLNLSKVVDIVRMTSAEAAHSLADVVIDMLHIDGNHDTKHVWEDYLVYNEKVSDGGIIVFDDINWNSVRECYEQVKDKYIVLYQTEYFAVLWKKKKNLTNSETANRLTTKITSIDNNINIIGERKLGNFTPIVTVGVLAYNHEKYIVECLDSIVSQVGEFKLRLVIAEDSSTDRTASYIESYLSTIDIHQRDITVEFYKNSTNLGMVRNLQQLINHFKDTDYFCLVDGDDYWINNRRIQAHINHMNMHPEYAITFDSLLLYHENTQKYEMFVLQQETTQQCFTTADIIQNYVIGNISCCFYDASYLNQIPESLFDMFVGDWMLNIVYSQFGDAGHIKEPMTVYRKHNQGIWTGTDEFIKRKHVLQLIDQYNQFTNYRFDEEFTNARRLPSVRIDERYQEVYDMVIIDDVFPHPVSGFRYEEFTNYYQYLESVKIVTTGWSVHVLGTESTQELITKYKQKKPYIVSKLEKYVGLENIDCKLLYFVFLGNAFSLVELAEARRIPFVFTLYPGGMFGLDNANSDRMLKRVVTSPCFRRVIVTQKVIYDYLIDKKFCTPDQVELIFGVVTPLNKLETEYTGKLHYGIDKNTLDICFVAHKYTKYGQDKGYDVFIEVAKRLNKKYNNVYFHVVGNFDENIIDVKEIRDRIKFYGIKQPEEFSEFYQDKDIVLSANIPGMIYKGSFDGFPTASCTDAALFRTAIFCTDPLNLNQGHFVDNRDLVLVKHDVNDIVAKIDLYYSNPLKLRDVCVNGAAAMKRIYGADNQIHPRIQLIKNELAKPFIYDEQDFVRINRQSLKLRIYNKLKKHCPQPIKQFAKKVLGR